MNYLKSLICVLVGLFFLPGVSAYLICNDEVSYVDVVTLNNTISNEYAGGESYNYLQEEYCGSIAQKLEYGSITDLAGYSWAVLYHKFYVDGVLTKTESTNVYSTGNFPTLPAYSIPLQDGSHVYRTEFTLVYVGSPSITVLNQTAEYTLVFIPTFPIVSITLPSSGSSVSETFDVQATVTESVNGIAAAYVRVRESTDTCASEFEGYQMNNPSGSTYIRTVDMNGADLVGDLVSGAQYRVCVYGRSNAGVSNSSSVIVTYDGNMKISGFVQDSINQIGISGVSVYYSSATISSLPVSYWSFDESAWLLNQSSADDVVDSVGNNDLLKSGGTWISSGYLGGALEFDGVNDYVENTTDTSDLETSTGTWSLWFNMYELSSVNGTIIMGKADTDGSHNGITISEVSGRLWVEVKDNHSSNYYTRTVPITLNNWHNIIVVYDSGNYYNVYYDGVLVTDRMVYGPPYWTEDPIYNNSLMSFSFTDHGGQPLRFGTSNDPYWVPFKGMIDEVRIYNTTLTSSEIQELYVYGLTQTVTGGYFEFLDMRSGSYDLTFSKTGYYDQSISVSLPPSSTSNFIYLVPVPGSGGSVGNGSVSVHLIDSAGVLLDISDLSCFIDIDTNGYAERVRNQSSHTFTGLDSTKNYTVTVGCVSYFLFERFNVTTGTIVYAVLSQGTPYSVNFLVTNQNGNARSGALVSMEGVALNFACTTDNYGRCSLVVFDGSYYMKVTSDNHYPYQERIEIHEDKIGKKEIVVSLNSVVSTPGLPEPTNKEIQSRLRQDLNFIWTVVVLAVVLTLFKLMGGRK